MGHCFTAANYQELYDDDPAKRGTTPWVVLSLETPNGKSRLTLGFTVSSATDEVGWELSLPEGNRLQQQAVGRLVGEFFEDLGLTHWKATCCKHNKGKCDNLDFEFDWGKDGYNAKTLQHLCPVCGYGCQIQRAPLTEGFTRMFAWAMVEAAAERNQALGEPRATEWWRELEEGGVL